MNKISAIIKYFNKKGVSSMVIGIILLVIGLAIIVLLVIRLGGTGSEKIGETTTMLDQLKRGEVV